MTENGSRIVIILFVDDLLLGSADLNLIQQVKATLCDEFKMKDFGQVSIFLGIEFELKCY